MAEDAAAVKRPDLALILCADSFATSFSRWKPRPNRGGRSCLHAACADFDLRDADDGRPCSQLAMTATPWAKLSRGGCARRCRASVFLI